MNHLSYLKYVLLHKWYVFLACWWLRVPLWQALIHDLSKFGSAEWGPYVRYFYGRKDEFLRGRLDANRVDADFDAAWNHHQKANPHHWQYWVLVSDSAKTRVRTLKIPSRYTREMVADWLGAGRGKTGSWDIGEWVEKAAPNMLLHPDTAVEVHDLLAGLGQDRAAKAILLTTKEAVQ